MKKQISKIMLPAFVLVLSLFNLTNVYARLSTDDITISPSSLPLIRPYATERTYTTFTATFIGEDLYNVNGDIVFNVEELETLLNNIVSFDDAVTSNDGNWVFEKTEVATTFTMYDVISTDENLASNVSPLNSVISTMQVSGVRRTFPAVNGGVSIPATIFHTHVHSTGRAYQGTISRTSSGFTTIGGVIVSGWGEYAGTLRHYGEMAFDLPIETLDMIYHETFGIIDLY